MLTSVANKRVALRNAIVNVAMSGAPGEVLHHMLLALVERVTHHHIMLLRCFAELDSVGTSRDRLPSLRQLRTALSHAVPLDKERRIVIDDLRRLGLIDRDYTHYLDKYDLDVPDMHLSIQLEAHLHVSPLPKVTDLGVDFLHFIQEPDRPDEPKEESSTTTG